MAIVRTFNSEIEAEMAMSALEAAGIESVMRRDDCGGVQPAMGLTGGVQVVVADEEMEAATEVLDAPPIEFGGPLDGDLES
ncbi:MAG: DUF2007 domain-containing protein [Acidobacteria bacterium]|nr:DUF2007 domain-containing protein [Acidobacteriota bacterium]